MSDPEPGKAEQALKAYASTRQRSAPPEFQIPPASKLAWEREVDLTYHRAARPKQSWWPRLALLGACAAMVVLSLNVRSPKDTPRMAAVERSIVEPVLTESRSEKLLDQRTPEATPAAAPPAKPRIEQAAVEDAAPTLLLARAERAAEPAPRASASSLLNNFTLNQRGAELELVDADGSVYSGQLSEAKEDLGARVRTAEIAARKRFAVSASAPQSPLPKAQATLPQALFFKASGTNLSLQQPITFEGQIWIAPEQRAATNSYVLQIGTNLSPETVNSVQNAILLEGTARVGSNATQRIQAATSSK